MWLPVLPDLPQEVLLGYSLTLVTTAILWLIVADFRRTRAAHHRTHSWILLAFIFMINATIVSIMIYYRRELVALLSNARTIATDPSTLLTLLITISYIIYAIYKRDTPPLQSQTL